MPEVTVNVIEEYDKKINMLKAERGISAKRTMIEIIIKEYFDNRETNVLQRKIIDYE